MKMRVEHIVPLSSQVLSHLRELQSLTGDSAWLFPNQQGAVHPVMSENTINHMIQRMGYKGRIVGHGFRSLFSTVANELGFNRDAIERQLAHSERNQVRAAYNRSEYLEERKVLMQWWADFLDEKESSFRDSGGDIQVATEELPRKYLNQSKVIPFKVTIRS
jgi:integrase